MLKCSDERVLQAIANLNGSTDTELMLKWLADEREKLRDTIEQASEDIVLRRAQGCAMGLGEFIATFRTAAETLRKIKDNRK